MTVPAALVTVTLESVEILSASVRVAMEVGHRPYVLAWVGARRFGRSRVVADIDAPFLFGPERGRWTHEVAVGPEASIPLAVEIWGETLGDTPLARLDAAITPPWTLGTTRVTTADLALTYRVIPRRVPTPPPGAVAPRSAAQTASRATLRLPDTVVVELTDVVGLYEPVPSPALGEPAARRRIGYLSEDDKGRVFRNRKLDGSFRADEQLVELHATIRVIRGFLPEGARVRWIVEDADDPSNDDPDVHADGGSYIDRHDYDPNTGEHLGSAGFDNEGSFDRWPRFETVSPYASEMIHDDEARTAIVGGKSAIRIHCPNVGGDNFAVRAEVVAESEFEGFGARTGVMSMWDRIDVEYVKMKSADPLAVQEIPAKFLPAFVQFDFSAPREIPDEPFLGRTRKEAEVGLVSLFARHFQHQHQPGWFCLIASLESYPTGYGPDPIYEGPVEVTVDVHDPPLPTTEPMSTQFATRVTFPGVHPDALQVRMSWGEPTPHGPQHFATFMGLETAATVHTPDPDDIYDEATTTITLDPHEYSPLFLAHDPGPERYFGPRSQAIKGSPPESGGYGVPVGPVDAIVWPYSARPILGQSQGYGGRTTVYTHALRDPTTGVTPPNAVAARTGTITHELIHALGFPHKCGNWDLRTRRDKVCVMNYQGQWLLRWTRADDIQLWPDTGDDFGHITKTEICARHVREIRRTHLEDLPDLHWK